VAVFGIEGKLVMLTRGPSPEHSEANYSLEMIELNG